MTDKRPNFANLVSSSESEYADDDSDDEPFKGNLQFDDGYDESYLGDDEDRDRLDAMTDREREEVLFGRSQRREALLTKFTVRQKLLKHKPPEYDTSVIDETLEKTTEKALNQTSTVGLPIWEAEVEEVSMSSQQSPKAKRHSAALEKLMAQRKRKKPNEAGSCCITASTGTSPISEAETVPSQISSNSEVNDEETIIERQQVIERISTLSELMRCRINRHKLAKWCHSPFFEEVVIGSYIRIGIGANEGESVYRVAQIVEVCMGNKIYDFEDTKTDKVIKIRHGTSERLFRMVFVSNQHFSDREFRRWKFVMEQQNQPLPTVTEVNAKAQAIKRYTNHTYTEQDINYILKEKRRLKLQPVNLAVRRSELNTEMAIARDNKDYKEMERIENELTELDNQRMSDEEKTSNTLENINRRNRQITTENVEAALIQLAEENKTAKPDPFTRRRCLPAKVVTNTRSNTFASPRETDEKKTDDQNADTTESTMPEEPVKEIPKKTTSPREDIDLYAVHDFEIDIDFRKLNNQVNYNQIGDTFKANELHQQQQRALNTFILPNSGLGAAVIRNDNASVNTPRPQQTVPGKRESINLDEYKRRRGLL